MPRSGRSGVRQDANVQAPRDGSSRRSDASGGADDVVPCARTGPGVQGLQERLRAAVERALCDPVSTIAGLAQVLQRQEGPVSGEPIETILVAAARTEGSLRDLLEYLECNLAGGVRIARRRVDLKLLCERVLDSIQEVFPETPIAFACDAPVAGWWDPDRIAALLSKLVLNAIEHGPPRRLVRVTLSGLPDRVVLDVWNAPPRIPDEVLALLFEPFAPSGRNRTARLGLGLCLSREIARAHGGSIEATSSTATGTTLRVTLPRARQ
jgi:signal transduction histidine kinase